jgi:hypothetical protein
VELLHGFFELWEARVGVDKVVNAPAKIFEALHSFVVSFRWLCLTFGTVRRLRGKGA